MGAKRIGLWQVMATAYPQQGYLSSCDPLLPQRLLEGDDGVQMAMGLFFVQTTIVCGIEAQGIMIVVKYAT